MSKTVDNGFRFSALFSFLFRLVKKTNVLTSF